MPFVFPRQRLLDACPTLRRVGRVAALPALLVCGALAMAGEAEEVAAASGVHVSVSFTGEVAEWRLKGPDGKYYTTGLLKAGSYVLGVRFREGAQWSAFPVPLGEGLEVKVDCVVESESCRVRSRPRS